MTILFGHPTGKPNSFQAALAHHEAGVLECFCISWMPWSAVMRVLRRIQPLRSQGQRLGRRQFLPLAHVPKIRCRYGESCRLFMRACGFGQCEPWLENVAVGVGEGPLCCRHLSSAFARGRLCDIADDGLPAFQNCTGQQTGSMDTATIG